MIVNHKCNLGLQIIAVGVETADQYEFLCDKGVEYIQGWFVAKAMTIREFDHVLQDNI